MTTSPTAAETSPLRATVAGVRHAVGLAWRSARGTFLLYVASTLASAVAPVAAAWLTKLILDRLVDPGAVETQELIILAAVLAGVGLASVALPRCSHYLRQEMGRAVGLGAAAELSTAISRFDGLTRFEDPQVLDRVKLAEQTARTTPNQVVDGGLNIVQGVLTAAGFVGSIFTLSPVMATVVVASAGPALAAELSLSRRRAGTLWNVTPAERREFFYSRLLSSVEAAKEIRLFGIGGFLRDRMLTERRTANAAMKAMDRRELAVQAGLGLLGAAVAGAGLVWVVLAARSGRLSIGDVAMLTAAVASTQSSLGSMVGEVARTHQALLMIGHYLAVVRMEPDLPVPRRPRPLPAPESRIELRDVWFTYSEDHPYVLRGVNLVINVGESIALVGRNGAGKSTLAKLLCRFYDPTRGSILWDGVDIKDVPIDVLRRRIGAVFQDFMCYDLTAAENIALGDLSAIGHRDRIQQAAERAGIHQRLSKLPNGYDTLLSRLFFSESDKDDPRTGVELSGGQWQRVALARALLRVNRDLMILDEPSAGLDAEAEHEIHTRLREHRAGQTSLLISHRLGAVRDADVIAVLDDGRITEQGCHDELIKADGTYAHLFRLQAEGYRAEVSEEQLSNAYGER